MTINRSYDRPFPGVLRIEPASLCNLRCSHCPTGTVSIKRGIMLWETFQEIMRQVSSNWKRIRVAVLYHGGEPLLNKDFTNMVREIKARGVPQVKTVSNGMLLTRPLADDIIASGLDSIEFSLDGESIDENNSIRRNCDGKKTLANISMLIDTKKRLGSATPAVYIASTQFRKKRNDFLEEPINAPSYITEFLSRQLGDIAGFKSTFAMKWPDLCIEHDLYEIITDPSPKEINNCDHANSTITIRWNGDVVPCCYDLTSKRVLGNILQNDLETIWNGADCQELRRSIHDRKFTAPCSRCNVVNPDDYLMILDGLNAK